MHVDVKGKLLAVRPDTTPKGKAFLRLDILQNGRNTPEIVHIKYWGTKPIGEFKVNTEVAFGATVRAYAGARGAGLDVSIFE